MNIEFDEFVYLVY